MDPRCLVGARGGPARSARDVIRVANAPVSYGAFELTVGVLPDVPGPEQLLDAIADAGYAGTELGPLGYLGKGAALRERLAQRELALAGAFVQMRFGSEGFEQLDLVLEALDGFDAKIVLADAGPREGELDWDALAHAVARVRRRGFAPTFHHHMGTRVQTPAEIDALLERSDVGLLLDTGHLAAAGGDPLQGLRHWRDRLDYVHLKDVRLDLLRGSVDWDEAWRSGVFCELGTGDVDLDAFLEELDGYSGWLVVEQDWIPGPGDDIGVPAAAQARNRRWLSEHAGV
jgi:inosose dehydratase